MRTLTRRQAAKELKIKDTSLLYWERQGKLKPEKVEVGKSTLIIYTPELVEEARKILSRKNRRGKRRK